MLQTSRPTRFAWGQSVSWSVIAPLLFLVLAARWSGIEAAEIDRTTLLLPRQHDATPITEVAGLLPDAAFGDAAGAGWHNYQRLWIAHHQSPSDTAIRRFLGLPLRESVAADVRRGRSAPRWLGWRSGSYQQLDTPHFTILSQADPAVAQRVAADLERCYWAWTQMFFPLWEASDQVTAALADCPSDTEISDHLQSRSERITIRRKLRIVLFRDAAGYQQTLGRDIPGIERSTGFYSDDRQTTFLYASEPDDAATRRHELVHQLFREATRSNLGRSIPGEESGFWLIEGIAGYFESLRVIDDVATVGGWDASRLQYARYRLFTGGDQMSMNELQVDGRLAAQRRADIARWYAHAIANTHRLLDSGDTGSRQWLYHQLAQRYKIDTTLPSVQTNAPMTPPLDQFLAIDDDHIAANPPPQPLVELCLVGCRVTATGLQHIPASSSLRWLDLAGLPVHFEAVRRLVPDPSSLEQLRLEATPVDSALIAWVAGADQLNELDLSWTSIDDPIIAAIKDASELSTLWMTGSKLTDAAIEPIVQMKQLRRVDLQRTSITPAGIARLQAARPDLEINPLQLRSQ